MHTSYMEQQSKTDLQWIIPWFLTDYSGFFFFFTHFTMCVTSGENKHRADISTVNLIIYKYACIKNGLAPCNF